MDTETSMAASAGVEPKENPEAPAATSEAPAGSAAASSLEPTPRRTDLFRLGTLRSIGLILAVAVPLTALTAGRTPAGGSFRFERVLDLLRAGMPAKLVENFQDDLTLWWTGNEGWSKTWSVDSAGCAHPGQLAIYIKSVSLANYDIEFLAAVEKSLGFVYRAMDFDNYYAGRIVIAHPGPLPEVVLERYAVINGHAGPKTSVKLPLSLRMDTLYQVEVEARGDHFLTRINKQLIDNFSDAHFRSGAVGFFSRSSESSGVCSLRVIGHEDVVGRVRSLFVAPSADQALVR
jgi:hypothetical protein